MAVTEAVDRLYDIPRIAVLTGEPSCCMVLVTSQMR